MKMIEAIVAPERLGDVKDALSRVEVFRLTVSDVTGLERAAPRGGVPFEPRARVRLEIAVNEAFVKPTVEAILAACGGSSPGVGSRGPGGGPKGSERGPKGSEQESRKQDGGGGRIYVHPLRDVIRVRTGERGQEAI